MSLISEFNCGTGEWITRQATVAEQAALDATAASAAAQVIAVAQATVDLAATRGAVVAQLTALVGLQWTAMTAAQRQLVIVALLFKAGALDKTLTVQPLANWL